MPRRSPGLRPAPGSLAVLAALAALALAPATAGAQDAPWSRPSPAAFDLQLFQPSPSPRAVFNVELPTITSHLTLTAGLWANYAHVVLVARDGADRAPVVRHAAQFEAHVALGLFEYFEVGVAMPLVAQRAPRDAGDGALDTGDLAGGIDPGDLRLYLKVPVLRGRTPVAVGLQLTAPTGDDRHFAGNPSWTFVPTVSVARAFGPVTLAANAGLRFRERNALGTFEANDEVTLGLGARWALGSPGRARVTLLAEAVARVTFNASEQNRNGSNAFTSEAFAGAEVRLARGVTATAGVGRGLTAGAGASDVRGLAGLRVAFERAPCATGPEDYDGFQDGDFCADPDNDRDGVADADDRCPNDPEDRDGLLDDDGCADPDNDGDGALDDADRCPIEPEDRDGHQDDDGCPELDNDRDERPDVRDTCPNEPEDVDQFQDDDGCPEPGPEAAVVTRTDTRLLLSQRIFFEFDSDRIRSVSFPILTEVANVLRLNADIARLRVEGYTSLEGTPAYNTDLSFRRARAVVEYLASRGVDRERLEFQGYGETRPVTDDPSPEGQSLNRRVEFTIVRQDDEPRPAPAPTPAPRPRRR